jgi:hypothetical protein
MKKYLLIILFLSLNCFAQEKVGSVKAGVFAPQATESGFILGYESSYVIDDNFFVGWSADWFNKNYVDKKLVSEFNDFYGPIHYELNELRAKTNLHSVPLMFSVNGSWIVSPRAKAFITGSAGIEALFIFYRNYDNPDNREIKAAFDFAWRLGTGINYELGFSSDVFVELVYHHSEPSWEYEVHSSETGRKKVLERKFDMSGILFRTGFRFYF